VEGLTDHLNNYLHLHGKKTNHNFTCQLIKPVASKTYMKWVLLIFQKLTVQNMCSNTGNTSSPV
jgi:hypothetical protein